MSPGTSTVTARPFRLKLATGGQFITRKLMGWRPAFPYGGFRRNGYYSKRYANKRFFISGDIRPCVG